MHIIRFLVWFVCFWPLIALTNYLHQKILEFPEVLVPTSHIWIAAYSCIWFIVILHELWFTRHQPNADASETSDLKRLAIEPHAPVRIVVEAPTTKQYEATNEMYVEQVLAFKKPLTCGLRIICEITDSGTILGTVVDVAEIETLDEEDPPICAWVKLDRAEDFEELCKSLNWSNTEINWRRSPLLPAPKAEVAQIA